MGFGQGVSDIANSADPLDVERWGSALSSPMLFGGVVGGGLGAVAKLGEKGLAKAKVALDAHIARLASPGTSDGASLVDDLAAFRGDMKEQKLWLATKGSEDAEIRTIGKQSLKADRQLDNLLDNPKALAENPRGALTALQKQEHALEQLTAKDATIRATADAESGIPRTKADILDEDAIVSVRARDLEQRGYFEPPGQGEDVVKAEKARKAIAEGQRDPVKAVVGSDGRIEITDGRNRLRAAIEADKPIKIQFERGVAVGEGEGVVLRGTGDGLPSTSNGARAAALDAVPAALERNRALQQRARDLMAGAPKQGLASSLAETAMQGAIMHGVAGMIPIPVVGHVAGAWIAKKATDLAFGRMGAAAGEVAKRTAGAVDAFIGAAGHAAPHVPVLATKVLGSVMYAPQREKRKDDPAQPEAPKLDKLYKARADELRSQVAYDMTGVARMRPDAREAMASWLSPIRAAHPVMADQLETIAARRIEYLASKLPKKPDLGVLQTGPDTWKPSELEMRTFARHAAAVEDPGAVEERLAHGTITPEDAEAYNAVYPERAAHFKQQILEQLPTLRAALPYKRRLALSIFSGMPVDAAMHPQILAVLQASFAAEPGSEGGTQAPRAQPQFGSVKKSVGEPTPAQERAQ